MPVRTLHSETEIPAPLPEVFDFFSKAENLQEITPPHLRFKILTPLPIQMAPGTLIDYRLQLFGIPFRWKTEITVWEPGRRFVDLQRKGPYKLWEHTHTFADRGDRTFMQDTVRYEAPGGILEPVIHALFVRRQVEKIFEYRATVIRRVFK